MVGSVGGNSGVGGVLPGNSSASNPANNTLSTSLGVLGSTSSPKPVAITSSHMKIIQNELQDIESPGERYKAFFGYTLFSAVYALPFVALAGPVGLIALACTVGALLVLGGIYSIIKSACLSDEKLIKQAIQQSTAINTWIKKQHPQADKKLIQKELKESFTFYSKLQSNIRLQLCLSETIDKKQAMKDFLANLQSDKVRVKALTGMNLDDLIRQCDTATDADSWEKFITKLKGFVT
jgi:hypothetical protein